MLSYTWNNKHNKDFVSALCHTQAHYTKHKETLVNKSSWLTQALGITISLRFDFGHTLLRYLIWT